MTALDDFRPGVAPEPKKKAKKDPWVPLMTDIMGYANVLAFDPSLSATGFVALTHTKHSGLHVIESATLSGAVPEDATGWERDMAVAEDLEDQLERLSTRFSLHEWEVVTEAPPLGGGQIRSPESAILACKTIRSVFRRRGFTLLPMQSPQAHKKATVGNSMIKKPEHHKLLAPVLEGLLSGSLHLITNGAKRDAVSVGLADLRRRGR